MLSLSCLVASWRHLMEKWRNPWRSPYSKGVICSIPTDALKICYCIGGRTASVVGLSRDRISVVPQIIDERTCRKHTLVEMFQWHLCPPLEYTKFLSTHGGYFLVLFMLNSGDNWRFFCFFCFITFCLSSVVRMLRCLFKGSPSSSTIMWGIEVSVCGSVLSPDIFRLPFCILCLNKSLILFVRHSLLFL